MTRQNTHQQTITSMYGRIVCTQRHRASGKRSNIATAVAGRPGLPAVLRSLGDDPCSHLSAKDVFQQSWYPGTMRLSHACTVICQPHASFVAPIKKALRLLRDSG